MTKNIHCERMAREKHYRDLFVALKDIKETGFSLNELKQRKDALYEELGTVLIRYVAKRVTGKKCGLNMWEIEELRSFVLEEYFRPLKKGSSEGLSRIEEILKHSEELWMACIEFSLKRSKSIFFEKREKELLHYNDVQSEEDTVLITDSIKLHKTLYDSCRYDEDFGTVETEIWLDMICEDVVAHEIFDLYMIYRKVSQLYKALLTDENCFNSLSSETKFYVDQLRLINETSGKERLRRKVNEIKFFLKEQYEDFVRIV